jgi:aminoglycoside phosphotransferase (APT) family kinase protein
MHHVDDWPWPVRAHLWRVYGEPSGADRLGGMSLGRVYRVHFPDVSVIVKTSPQPTESLFYEKVAGRLRQAGIPIPELKWSCHLPDSHWLILEDIPHPLPVPPPNRWRPDPRVVAVLARLHRATRDWALDFPESPARAWTDRATDAALTCFPAGVAAALEPRLRALQREANHLAEGWCWISGDASPPNWGVRRDGSVALYDWELFRRGVPASDLAPAVAGLGDGDTYRQLAAHYMAAWDRTGEPLPWSVDTLARDIALAKVAAVTLLLRAHVDAVARVPSDVLTWLVERVPAWVQRLR